MLANTHDRGDVAVVRPSTDVVHHRVADLRQSLDECVDGTRHVVVDLADVRYLSAEALTVLADKMARLRKLGREIKLVAASDHVKSLLDLSGLAQTADICSDREAAFAGFGLSVGRVERSLLSRLDSTQTPDAPLATA